MDKIDRQNKIAAIKFSQWLGHWDEFEYSKEKPNRKPNKNIYMFTMSAAKLREYSDVFKRERKGYDAEGIQRVRDEKRTERIKRFVESGYPYGDLKEAQRTQEKLALRKPGWLPTAIVINILEEGDSRKGRSLNSKLAVNILDTQSSCELLLPDLSLFDDDSIRPFEVIDGQHRLWAFDRELDGDYELPVVAFHGLDIAWQAYLFWSINVSPKRINPSHAFDLYPLLRNQSWLEQTGELTVYREARAQELTEWLYKHPKSPWKSRINMLGEKGMGRVSQAAFVRSLTAAFFGTGRGKAGRYGLFQADISDYGEPLSWTRAQQVSLLLELWTVVADELNNIDLEWVAAFYKAGRNPLEDKSSLLNQDMGVRAAHAVANDIFYRAATDWGLDSWTVDVFDETDTTEEDINAAWSSLRKQGFYKYIRKLGALLVQFDWRSLDGPEVRDHRNLMLTRRAYRGSGGYTLLTQDIIKKIADSDDTELAKIASELVVE